MKDIDDIQKAIKYITSIRNESCVVLDNFKKEIEANKDSKTTYNTLVYDNRIANCYTILEVLGKAIPRMPIFENWCPARCPYCDAESSDSLGDGFYRHWYGLRFCDCGQPLKWED